MSELSKHIKQVKADTEKYEEVAEKLAIVKEEVFDMKVDILGAAFGMLMTKVNESIDDWLKIIAEKGEQDKGLGDKIRLSVESAITAIAQQKPPEVKVNVDMKPLQSIAADISKGNENILNLLNKFLAGDGGKSDELHRLIVALVGRQNIFLEKGMQQFDYTKQLNTISEKMGKERVEDLVVKRNELREITNVVPVYKDAAKK